MSENAVGTTNSHAAIPRLGATWLEDRIHGGPIAALYAKSMMHMEIKGLGIWGAPLLPMTVEITLSHTLNGPPFTLF